MACALSLAATPPAAAAPQAARMAQRYDIPAQSLNRALASFARISGVDILYENALAAGRLSAPVSGAMSPQAALRALLQGTGLSARFTGHRAAIVFLASGPAPEGPVMRPGIGASVPSLRLDMAEVIAPARIGSPDRTGWDRYAQLALTRIRARLTGDATLRDDVFRLHLAIGVEQGGRIEQVRMIRGSGDAKRDAHVQRTLIGYQLPPPPAGLDGMLRFEVASGRVRKGG